MVDGRQRSVHQFPVRIQKRRSCQVHIMRLADEIYKAINNKQFTLPVVIDLEKAFDLVWHNGLLYNMKQVGLRGNVFKFVEDFLNDPSIQVRVGAAMFSTYFLELNASGQCAEPTTVHHHDQRLARIVKQRQARTARGLQFDVEIWSEPVSLPAVPSGDGKILRGMGLQDLDQQGS